MGKTVYAVATGDTYEIVTKYGIHATPATKAYPRATGYIIPIKKGGLCEYLYKIVNYLEIKPKEIDKLIGTIPDSQFNSLIGYHKDRLTTFRYDNENGRFDERSGRTGSQGRCSNCLNARQRTHGLKGIYEAEICLPTSFGDEK